MSDKASSFLQIMRDGCPELEHVGGPLERIELQWAERFKQIRNTLTTSRTIHQTAFTLAKQALVDQVRAHQVPNGQLWEMRHPVWEAYDCGLVYFDIADDGEEVIEMRTTPIKGLCNLDYFTGENDVDYSGKELSYFRLELLSGADSVVRIEDIKLEAATDRKTQCALIGSLLTTLSFAKLQYI